MRSKVSDDGACVLAEAFSTNNVPRWIMMHGSEISDVGVAALVRAAKANNGLIIGINASSQNPVIIELNKCCKRNSEIAKILKQYVKSILAAKLFQRLMLEEDSSKNKK